jgi:hypothetical protein
VFNHAMWKVNQERHDELLETAKAQRLVKKIVNGHPWWAIHRVTWPAHVRAMYASLVGLTLFG